MSTVLKSIQGMESCILTHELGLCRAGQTAVEVAAAQKNGNLKEVLETQADYVGVFSLPVRKTFGRTSSEEVYGVVAPRIPAGVSPSATRPSALWLSGYRCVPLRYILSGPSICCGESESLANVSVCRNSERCKEIFRFCLAGAAVTPVGADSLVVRLGSGQAFPKALVGNHEVILSAVQPPAPAPCAPLTKLAEVITASGGYTPHACPSQGEDRIPCCGMLCSQIMASKILSVEFASVGTVAAGEAPSPMLPRPLPAIQLIRMGSAAQQPAPLDTFMPSTPVSPALQPARSESSLQTRQSLQSRPSEPFRSPLQPEAYNPGKSALALLRPCQIIMRALI